MALDESAIRRIMREEREAEKRERETAEREAKRDTEIAELRETVKGLSSKKPEKEEDPDAHDFVE